MTATNKRESLNRVLRFDPLAEAERVTGKSYKDDADTMNLGMGMALLHNAHKEDVLRSSADSYYNMSFADQLAMFADLGFVEVLRDNFDGTDGSDVFVILWHADGLLATCESCGTHRNNAKVYYNYRHDSGGYPAGLTSSGGMRGEVWVGDHDAREGIRQNLNAMRAVGQFLPVWQERPWLWLLNYSESKVDGYDYAAINADRIARLPEHVRASITPASAA